MICSLRLTRSPSRLQPSASQDVGRAHGAQTIRERNFVALSGRADYMSAVPIMNVMS